MKRFLSPGSVERKIFLLQKAPNLRKVRHQHIHSSNHGAVVCLVGWNAVLGEFHGAEYGEHLKQQGKNLRIRQICGEGW